MFLSLFDDMDRPIGIGRLSAPLAHNRPAHFRTAEWPLPDRAKERSDEAEMELLLAVDVTPNITNNSKP